VFPPGTHRAAVEEHEDCDDDARQAAMKLHGGGVLPGCSPDQILSASSPGVLSANSCALGALRVGGRVRLLPALESLGHLGVFPSPSSLVVSLVPHYGAHSL